MAPLETVRLTVGQIRQQIFQVSGTASAGSGSLAGRLFHRAAESAFAEESPTYWRRSLPADLNAERWSRALYDLALGSELTRTAASLREHGEDVLAVWNGLRSFAHWFCGLVREASLSNVLEYETVRERWRGADALFCTEFELTANLREDSWPCEVIVSGRADQLIRLAPDRWCVVEFKLGGGHPESDAAQVCLYHELLGGKGSAALLHFAGNGQPSETMLDSASIARARPALLALIGAMAGISVEPPHDGPDQAPPQSTPAPQVIEWPKAPRDAEIEIGKRLVRALREFGADSSLAGDPLVGPTFVRYPLEPGRGVSAGKVEKQGSNLQMRLQLSTEPYVGRAAGRIVVDIQRDDREYVSFRSLLPDMQHNGNGGKSLVLAGVDLYGEIHFVNLAKDAPHILVGGVPGSGKSEWLRCAAASLVASNTPDTLRLILIDPKKNAFADLAGSPYLWNPKALIDSPEVGVVPMLEDLVTEIGRRNDLFKKERVDNLAHYAQKTGAAPPRLVCLVDEFADLLMGSKKALRAEIEEHFIRLAQVGRAAGVHLILATQRPSRQIVTGLLKANIPTKIALRVSNRVESGVLLDQTGAEFLLGTGDLLLSNGGQEPVRLQSAWISEEDRRSIFGGNQIFARTGS